MDHNVPWQAYDAQGGVQPTPKSTFPTGKKEVVFAGAVLLCALALCNFTLFGGFNLGFAIAALAYMACAFGYLLAAGCRPSAYSAALLCLSVVITAAFPCTDDSFVKFVMLCFLSVSVNLSLCLMANQNLRDPGSVSSLIDAPRVVFRLGVGRLHEAFRGLREVFRRSGTAGKKGGAFLLGICLCVPVLAIVIPLLISADAAFDGLVALLPEFGFSEFFVTVIFGCLLACTLYTRSTALRHSPRETPRVIVRKGINAITVNTVLGAVCVVYFAYLVSQLAYFAGGFAGILPEGYTPAQYARRGFFEMAFLSAVNLGMIGASLGLVRKTKAAPISTKVLCLFIGMVTLFLIAAASAKMFLYIGTYGLTRLRVLTQVTMLFMAVTTLLVMVWLLVPKLPYMKAIILAALVIGATTIWADVDTQVARYNVDAYLSGKLETVDVYHLSQLGSGAVPQLARLAEEAADEEVRTQAQEYLKNYWFYEYEDIRGWNYVNYNAAQYLPAREDGAPPEDAHAY